jgi:hypothetical protein
MAPGQGIERPAFRLQHADAFTVPSHDFGQCFGGAVVHKQTGQGRDFGQSLFHVVNVTHCLFAGFGILCVRGLDPGLLDTFSRVFL